MANRAPSVSRLVLTIIAAAIVYFAVLMVLSLLTQIVLPYDMMKVPGVRSTTDPIMLAFFIYPLVYMVGVVILYPLFKLKWTVVQKGLAYGFIIWLVTNVPESYVIYTSMVYPEGFFVDKLLFGLIAWIAAGTTIAYLLKE
jgi:hypothetical protein